MTSEEIRKLFLGFFKERSHAIIPSSSLIPENDSTTLFTGSGMQPLIPYLLGQSHPEGKRLVNSQKSFRAEDIDEVGDNRHTTFFEILTKELGIDPNHLYVSVFAGDKATGIPADDEAAEIWKDIFKKAGIDA